MRKLLKYDLRSMNTVFIISSISLFLFSLFGTLCSKVTTQYEMATRHTDQLKTLNTFASIGLGLTIVALSAYTVLIAVFVYKRYYTHLFTDQGYLTFTLPVKRREIFASKLFFGLIYFVLAEIIVAGCLFFMGIFGKYGTFINQDVIKAISEFFKDAYIACGNMMYVYIGEAILLWLITNCFGILMAYSCISVGAMLVKKYKIVVGIGIYYGINAVFAPIFWVILVAFIDSHLWDKVAELTIASQQNVVALILALGFFCMLGVCTVLCGFNTFLTKKKINIA